MKKSGPGAEAEREATTARGRRSAGARPDAPQTGESWPATRRGAARIRARPAGRAGAAEDHGDRAPEPKAPEPEPEPEPRVAKSTADVQETVLEPTAPEPSCAEPEPEPAPVAEPRAPISRAGAGVQGRGTRRAGARGPRGKIGRAPPPRRSAAARASRSSLAF